MATRRSTAISRAFRRLLEVGGVTITYRRNDSTASILMLPAKNQDFASEEFAAILEGHQQDWLALAEALVLGGSRIVPEDGDTITDGTTIWKVLPMDGGGLCFQWHGPERQGVRIHTKIVSE